MSEYTQKNILIILNIYNNIKAQGFVTNILSIFSHNMIKLIKLKFKGVNNEIYKTKN